MAGRSTLGHSWKIEAKMPHSWIWKCSLCGNSSYTEKNVIPHPDSFVLVKSGLLSKMEHLSCEEYVLWQVNQ